MARGDVGRGCARCSCQREYGGTRLAGPCCRRSHELTTLKTKHSREASDQVLFGAHPRGLVSNGFGHNSVLVVSILSKAHAGRQSPRSLHSPRPTRQCPTGRDTVELPCCTTTCVASAKQDPSHPAT